MDLFEEIGAVFDVEQKKAIEMGPVRYMQELKKFASDLDIEYTKKMLLIWERELRHILMKEFKPKYFARTDDTVADDRIAALFFFSRIFLDMVGGKSNKRGDRDLAIKYIAKFFALYVCESLDSRKQYLQEKEKILSYEKRVEHLEKIAKKMGIIGSDS